MHLVVTGASGFIGQRVCEDLLKAGHKVTPFSFKKSKFDADSKFLKNVEITSCDLTINSEVNSKIESIKKIDGIIHLAGQTFRKDSPGAVTYFQSNFISTLNLLESCRLFHIPKFVLASSIAVYGLSSGQHEPKFLPVNEEHPVKPFDFYGLSKFFAEELCQFFHKNFSINCQILRFSRVFGPGLKKGLFFNAISKALSNSQIDVTGNISSDFVYIKDVVNAIINSLNITGFNIFNIGSGEEKTIHEVVSKIIEMTNSSSKINLLNNQQSKFSLDISKAKSKLYYQTTPLEQSLIEMIKYVKTL